MTTANDGHDETTEAESYHGYSVDDETQPQGEGDSLVDDRGLEEPLDEGYSPPEKWSAGQGWGNTPLEEEMGETLDQRLAQEVPEEDPYSWTEPEARTPTDPTEELIEEEFEREVATGAPPEVGADRAGRLVDPDEGVREDTEPDLEAEDVGIDGAGSSAEEAAVHVVEDEPERP